MRVTTKGQVTIPLHIREKMGVTPHSDVDFIVKGEQVLLVKAKSVRKPENKKSRFNRFRGVATVKMSTSEIMELTRGSK